MNRRYAIPGFACALLAFASHLFGQASMQTLLTNGPASRRVNIVFLSEGYTAEQLPQFTNDALAVLFELGDTLPLQEYSNCFNAFAISVPSVESGSDHPSGGIYRDTYFNSTYDSQGIARLITIDSIGRSRVNALLGSFMPLYDIAALIVNDPQYGGSGGSILIASVHSSSAEIAIHELGHTFADLGDEYSDPYPGYPDTEEPNTTTQTERGLIKWNAWILPTTLIPTPPVASNSAVVGLFEGAHYHVTGWYRPKLNCKMRALFIPFCEVCSETLIESIYGQIRPIDALSPATNSVLALTNSDVVQFSVTPLVPSTHALRIQWYVNNLPAPGATSAVFTVTAPELLAGTNRVRVRVSDDTTFVRTDPTAMLTDWRTWWINRVIPTPQLFAAFAEGKVELTWTANAAGFTLESCPHLASNSLWTPMLTISNQTHLLVDPTNAGEFFRLHKP